MTERQKKMLFCILGYRNLLRKYKPDANPNLADELFDLFQEEIGENISYMYYKEQP